MAAVGIIQFVETSLGRTSAIWVGADDQDDHKDDDLLNQNDVHDFEKFSPGNQELIVF